MRGGAGDGPSGGDISDPKKPGRRTPLLAVLLLDGCTVFVHPTGPEVVAELGRGPALASWLAGQGYEPISDTFGGPRPGGVAAASTCYEKARGGAATGVDVVRACFGPDGAPRAVYTMHTHGLPWREIWPRDIVVDTNRGGVDP